MRTVSGLLGLLAAALVLAGGGTAAQPATSADQMAQRVRAAPLPARDPLDLAVRLRGAPADIPLASPPVEAPRPVGAEEWFWIVDQRAASMFQVSATLRLVTDHAYWYVQTDRAAQVAQEDLDQSAAAFESSTYPTIRLYFGVEPSPGVDGDPRIVFLLAGVPGVAAYFSGADASPRAVNPRSNERDIIYVNVDALRPGGPGFDATMAHEFQHMVQFARCPMQETWIEEGAAELASRVAGYSGPRLRQFVARPDVQLTQWTDVPGEVSRHYQAAYLFLRYAAERGGGFGALPELVASRCARGGELFSSFLAERGGWPAPDFDRLFADWTVANLVDDTTAEGGRFGYAGEDLNVSVTAAASAGLPLEGRVPQYAANYIELPTGGASVSFTGDTTVPLIPASEPGRGVWWSNRADSLDTRLTRWLDLRGVTEATARFRVWYDIESRFDFAYLVASQDGGRTWQTLAGRYTIADDALGNAFGVGWTGVSGGGATPEWLDEEVDLTPYAGSEVLLRFEYVTDQGYNARGFAMAGFEVPAIGLADAAADGAWQPEGWVWVDAPVPQAWHLRLVRWTDEGLRVDEVPVAVDGTAWAWVDDATRRAVLVVAPTAVRTIEPATYTLLAT